MRQLWQGAETMTRLTCNACGREHIGKEAVSVILCMCGNSFAFWPGTVPIQLPHMKHYGLSIEWCGEWLHGPPRVRQSWNAKK